MSRFRNSISMKLFAAMLLVATLIIVFVTGIIAINMRSGFSQYLAQAELARFNRLHDSLVFAHDDARPGWPQFRGDRRAWNDFVRSAVPGPELLPPPPRRARPVRPSRRLDGGSQLQGRPPPPRRFDPMNFGERLLLIDSKGERVAGGRPDAPIFAKRPIQPDNTDQNSPILGWIGLTGDPRQMSGGNALFLKDQLLALTATSIVALILSAIAAYFLSLQFLSPVRKLADAGEQLSAGDYTIRVDDNRSDEMGVLLKQFNTLAESLQTRDKTERKWISDTSHELKTPLAVLRAQIEAIQDGVHKADDHRMNELHASTMRLSQLVADLNSLSNMREGQLATNTQTENISDILSLRLENTLEHLTNTELTVETELEPDLLLECDRFRIGQLLDNLLQNAIRYTSAPGHIRITARSHGNNVIICVEDSPPCPPQNVRDKMFDRFYREELSRDRKYGGSGLGLAICREIVNAHHGTISLAASQLGGLNVSITLPKRQP